MLTQPTLRCNVRNNHGETPLFLSIENEANEEIVNILLSSGCDINIGNDEGVTPLHLAVRWKSSDIAHKLILRGTDVNSRDYDGYTPLHEAATKNQYENVCMLLYYNALANEKTIMSGATPFHMACNYESSTASAKYLMNYVADIDDVDAAGYTALHIALNNKSDLAKDIAQYGANVNIFVNGVPPIYFSLFYKTSDIFELIWSRSDCGMLLDLKYPLLLMFMTKCKFSTDQFLKCLYMIFESPYVHEFLDQHFQNYEDSLFSCIAHKDISLEERIKIYCLFLSCSVTVYYNDICLIHDKYGFDKSLETILTSGCCIALNKRNRFNLLVSRICYDNFSIYVRGRDYFTKSILQSDRKHYYKFYSPTECVTVQQMDGLKEVMRYKDVRTLLELSRDAVRANIFKKCKKPFAFNVYSVISSLHLPTKVKDVLFLKEPLFRDSRIYFFVG